MKTDEIVQETTDARTSRTAQKMIEMRTVRTAQETTDVRTGRAAQETTDRMTCEIVRDLLPLYIDDACSEGSRRLVREHLKNCAECEKEYRLMMQPAKEEQTEDFAAVEEQLLKEGKERIETGVKRRIADKIRWFDLSLNVFFLILGVRIRDLFFHATKLPWYGKVLNYEELNQTEHFSEFMQLTSIVLACFMFLVCDLLALFFKKKGRLIFDNLLTISLFMKILYAVIMTAVGFMYLYSELVSLCG